MYKTLRKPSKWMDRLTDDVHFFFFCLLDTKFSLVGSHLETFSWETFQDMHENIFCFSVVEGSEDWAPHSVAVTHLQALGHTVPHNYELSHPNSSDTVPPWRKPRDLYIKPSEILILSNHRIGECRALRVGYGTRQLDSKSISCCMSEIHLSHL